MKLNIEDMPGKMLGLVQIGAVGSIIGLLLLSMLSDMNNTCDIVVFVGVISMFTYTLLLSTGLFNVKMSRGMILIALTYLGNLYLVGSMPHIVLAIDNVTAGARGVFIYGMYFNFALLTVCTTSWVITVFNSFRTDKK